MPNNQIPAIDNYWERDLELLLLLKKMESRGVLIDQDMCRREIAFGENRLWKLQNSPNFDGRVPTRPTDLAFMFVVAGVPLLEDHKTKNGNYSFNKEAMVDYDRLLETREDHFSDMAKQILEYRGWTKTISSNYKPYLNLVSPDGRLRCNFNQAGTKTGRLSCNDPNLQQIPRNSEKRWNGKLKEAFIPKPGYRLVACDYSQLEFRLAAAYARQLDLMELFNKSKHPEIYSKEERDVFTQMSTELGMDRQACKTLTYAKGFGAGMLKIAIMLGEDIPQWVRDNYRKSPNMSVEQEREYRAAWKYIRSLKSSAFYDDWEAKYDRMVKHSEFVNKQALERGYIRNWTGRRRRFEGRERGQAHKAYNSLIQGSGAEVVKSAMLRLNREIDNPECQMLLQVHDSVLFEIKEGRVDYYLPMIQEIMARVEEEFDFGVYFATEPEYWGKKD